jgi:hypothetical protein
MQHPISFLSRIQPAQLSRHALLGASIAFMLIGTAALTIFTLAKNGGDLGLWTALPIFTVTIGGACGGLFYYLAHTLFPLQSWKKWVLNLACLVVYAIGLWLSLILALNFTGHWS